MIWGMKDVGLKSMVLPPWMAKENEMKGLEWMGMVWDMKDVGLKSMVVSQFIFPNMNDTNIKLNDMKRNGLRNEGYWEWNLEMKPLKNKKKSGLSPSWIVVCRKLDYTMRRQL